MLEVAFALALCSIHCAHHLCSTAWNESAQKRARARVLRFATFTAIQKKLLHCAEQPVDHERLIFRCIYAPLTLAVQLVAPATEGKVCVPKIFEIYLNGIQPAFILLSPFSYPLNNTLYHFLLKSKYLLALSNFITTPSITWITRIATYWIDW